MVVRLSMSRQDKALYIVLGLLMLAPHVIVEMILWQKGRKVNDKSKSLTRYAKRSACFLV
jgi:hypothetical protein